MDTQGSHELSITTSVASSALASSESTESPTSPTSPTSEILSSLQVLHSTSQASTTSTFLTIPESTGFASLHSESTISEIATHLNNPPVTHEFTFSFCETDSSMETLVTSSATKTTSDLTRITTILGSSQTNAFSLSGMGTAGIRVSTNKFHVNESSLRDAFMSLSVSLPIPSEQLGKSSVSMVASEVISSDASSEHFSSLEYSEKTHQTPLNVLSTTVGASTSPLSIPAASNTTPRFFDSSSSISNPYSSASASGANMRISGVKASSVLITSSVSPTKSKSISLIQSTTLNRLLIHATNSQIRGYAGSSVFKVETETSKFGFYRFTGPTKASDGISQGSGSSSSNTHTLIADSSGYSAYKRSSATLLSSVRSELPITASHTLADSPDFHSAVSTTSQESSVLRNTVSQRDNDISSSTSKPKAFHISISTASPALDQQIIPTANSGHPTQAPSITSSLGVFTGSTALGSALSARSQSHSDDSALTEAMPSSLVFAMMAQTHTKTTIGSLSSAHTLSSQQTMLAPTPHAILSFPKSHQNRGKYLAHKFALKAASVAIPTPSSSTSAEQTTSTSAEQTTSTSAEQTTSTSAEQTTSTSAEQTTGSSVLQTTTTSAEQTTSASAEQITSTSAEQTTGSSVQQTTTTSAEQTTSASAEQITSTSTEQTTSSSAEQTTSSSAEQTTSSSAEQTTSEIAEQTTGISSQQTISVGASPTASIQDAQTTSSSAEQTTSSSAEQTTSSSAEETTSSSVEKTASSGVEQTTGSSVQHTSTTSAEKTASSGVEQTTGSSVQQTSTTSAEQTTSSGVEQTNGSSVQQTTNTSGEQTTSANAEQITSTSTEQNTSASAEQITSRIAEQTTGTNSQQTTSAGASPTASTQDEQTTGTSTDQTASTGTPQAISGIAEQTTGTNSQQTASASASPTASTQAEQATGTGTDQTASTGTQQTTSASAEQTTRSIAEQTTGTYSQQISAERTTTANSQQSTSADTQPAASLDDLHFASTKDEQTTGTNSLQTASVSASPTASVQDEQTTGTSTDQSAGTGTPQTTSGIAEQTTGTNSQQTTIVGASPTASIQDEQTTGTSTDVIASTGAQQTTSVSAEHSNSGIAELTGTTGARQTTSVGTSPTASTQDEQTTGTSTDQTASTRTSQTTSGIAEQTTGTNSQQTASVGASPTASTQDEQTTGTVTDQTASTYTQQTTSAGAEQTKSGIAEQTTGTNSQQTTSVGASPTASTQDEQTTGTVTDQTASTGTQQTTSAGAAQTTSGIAELTGTSSLQTTSVGASPTASVQDEQTTGTSTDQTASTGTPQTTSASAEQTSSAITQLITSAGVQQTISVGLPSTTAVNSGRQTSSGYVQQSVTNSELSSANTISSGNTGVELTASTDHQQTRSAITQQTASIGTEQTSSTGVQSTSPTEIHSSTDSFSALVRTSSMNSISGGIEQPSTTGFSVSVQSSSYSPGPTTGTLMSSVLNERQSGSSGLRSTAAPTSGVLATETSSNPSSQIEVSDRSSPTATQSVDPTNTGSVQQSASGVFETTSAQITVSPSEVSQTVGTQNWLPSNLVTASAVGSANSQSSFDMKATATLPQVILPPTAVAKPENYSQITVGFKRSLNYPFLIDNPLASAQIFSFLPDILRYPFVRLRDQKNGSAQTNTKRGLSGLKNVFEGVNNPDLEGSESTDRNKRQLDNLKTLDDSEAFRANYSDVAVSSIVPLIMPDDTYLSSIAVVYFPTVAVDILQRMILNNESRIYSNPDQSLRSLSLLIDPTIPLTGLISSDGSSGSGSQSGNSGSPSGSSGSGSGSSNPNSNSDDNEDGGNSGVLDGYGLFKSTFGSTKRLLIFLPVFLFFVVSWILLSLFIFGRLLKLEPFREKANGLGKKWNVDDKALAAYFMSSHARGLRRSLDLEKYIGGTHDINSDSSSGLVDEDDLILVGDNIVFSKSTGLHYQVDDEGNFYYAGKAGESEPSVATNSKGAAGEALNHESYDGERNSRARSQPPNDQPGSIRTMKSQRGSDLDELLVDEEGNVELSVLEFECLSLDEHNTDTFESYNNQQYYKLNRFLNMSDAAIEEADSNLKDVETKDQHIGPEGEIEPTPLSSESSNLIGQLSVKDDNLEDYFYSEDGLRENLIVEPYLEQHHGSDEAEENDENIEDDENDVEDLELDSDSLGEEDDDDEVNDVHVGEFDELDEMMYRRLSSVSGLAGLLGGSSSSNTFKSGLLVQHSGTIPSSHGNSRSASTASDEIFRSSNANKPQTRRTSGSASHSGQETARGNQAPPGRPPRPNSIISFEKSNIDEGNASMKNPAIAIASKDLRGRSKEKVSWQNTGPSSSCVSGKPGLEKSEESEPQERSQSVSMSRKEKSKRASFRLSVVGTLQSAKNFHHGGRKRSSTVNDVGPHGHTKNDLDKIRISGPISSENSLGWSQI
ncbi:LANO_0D03510g1_1 [Lachancea nothofagi CBS 11611]|uniref:LANO_0D03510g1_1 n=1 Tax=Lachancea nothofagi CBS 11611 TaxID=1266666 RepID=A0A1G4JFB5_9SACH|nr:LANO_0D03510g1_1 [Lachancea nothofagi CBS 11611]